MVPLLTRAMAHDTAIRSAITGAFDHMLVDEYQDVNPGQLELIAHFVAAGVKLWAVGDDDQTLYAFRASDIRTILDFGRHHPGARIHTPRGQLPGRRCHRRCGEGADTPQPHPRR